MSGEVDIVEGIRYLREHCAKIGREKGPDIILSSLTSPGEKLNPAELVDRIARKILRVQTVRYKTAECRNIALGHAIDSLDLFCDRITDKEPVLAMVRKQVRNSRNSTRKKAERFLRRHRL